MWRFKIIKVITNKQYIKHCIFRTRSVPIFRLQQQDLSWAQKAELLSTYRPKYQTLNKVHKANNLKCDMPLSESITHATIWYKREIFMDKMWI